MKYALQTDGISKCYGRKKVLDNISITVKRGSIYGIIGMNGSGKTTFMRILTGLTSATSGSYRLFGSNDLKEGHKRIGSLIENPGIYKYLTARENLEFFRKLYGIAEKEIVDELLVKVNIVEAADKKVNKFSLGMKQRLSIAIALLGNPDMLILDEPINGLDPKGVLEVRQLLLELNDQYGITILISSHIISELYKLSTDYLIISKGKFVEQLTKEELEDKVNKCIKVGIAKDDVKRATRILEINLGIKEYDVLDGNIIRIFEYSDISKVNIALAKEEVAVKSLMYSGENIEEYFINRVREDA